MEFLKTHKKKIFIALAFIAFVLAVSTVYNGVPDFTAVN